jgi:DNA-binding CsgD family transcriptional regulator
MIFHLLFECVYFVSIDYFMSLNQHLQLSIETWDLIQLANTSTHHCLFIKNERSSYCYANQNYIQLMGLDHLKQLRSLNDRDLSKDKKDADKYRLLDCYVLEEKKPLVVSELISPHYNQPILKTMEGTLYPLLAENDQAKYVLGIVKPKSKVLKLDFDTLFKINTNDLKTLLKKRSYLIKLSFGNISLSRMEILTLIHLLRGAHAGEIAQALSIKQTTIESYLGTIRDKFDVDSKSKLINLITSNKILEQIIL